MASRVDPRPVEHVANPLQLALGPGIAQRAVLLGCLLGAIAVAREHLIPVAAARDGLGRGEDPLVPSRCTCSSIFGNVPAPAAPACVDPSTTLMSASSMGGPFRRPRSRTVSSNSGRRLTAAKLMIEHASTTRNCRLMGRIPPARRRSRFCWPPSRAGRSHAIPGACPNRSAEASRPVWH